LRKLPHKLRQLARSMYLLAADPRQLGSNSRRLWRAWRTGGTPMLKHQLLSLGHPDAPTIPVAPTDAWQDYQQRLASEVLPVLRAEIASLTQPVSISILVPTYNTDPAMLTAMVDSVRAQIYPHWELCIADDASTQPHVRSMLQALAAQEPRIKLHLGERNHGVSHASNRALALATSPFVVLLDHDDLLQPQAIYRVAQSVMTRTCCTRTKCWSAPMASRCCSTSTARPSRPNTCAATPISCTWWAFARRCCAAWAALTRPWAFRRTTI